MLIFPDKHRDKSTVTQKLRDDIIAESVFYDGKSYLEIGSSYGHTALSVSHAYKKIVCIENDEERHLASLRKQDELRWFETLPDVEIVNVFGTIEDLSQGSYDVILIDASHRYGDVKNDFVTLLSKNDSKSFTVFFHDYGLLGDDVGVKRYIEETFLEDEIQFAGEQDGWNPRGRGVLGFEAAKVVVNESIKKRVLG